MRSVFRKPAALAASVALAATTLVAGTAVSAAAAAGQSGTQGSSWDTRMVSVALDHTDHITYGQQVTLSGYLQSKEQHAPDQAYGYGPDGAPVTVSAYRTVDCTGSAVSLAVPSGNDGVHAGAFSATFRPDAAGSWSFSATLASGFSSKGRTYGGASSECLPLTVAQAPTTSSLTSAPTSVTVGSSVNLGYLVESAYGVSPILAGGSVTVEDVSGPGALCSPTPGSAAVSVTQHDADGSGAADAGFVATGTVSCTPAQAGIYTVELAYSGDHNYTGSTSDQIAITVVATDECRAAPAIAGDYMRQKNIGSDSQLWNTVINDVAGQVGVHGLLFAGDSCKPDYASRVTGYIDLHYGTYGL